MREITFSVFLLGLLLLAGCKSHSQEDPCTSNLHLRTFLDTQVSLDATAGCINAIHARLVSLQHDYPQLSEVKGATITATSLSYAKGNVLYEGKREQWSSPDACIIRVGFEKYSLEWTHQQAGGRKFPESGIQAYWAVHRAVPRDSEELLRAVSSIIKEEIERFEKSLE